MTNASRADWLLSYPLLMKEVGIWGRRTLRSDCSTDHGSFYVEAIFPPVLPEGVAPGGARQRSRSGRFGAPPTHGTSGLFANSQSYLAYGPEVSIRLTDSFGIVASGEQVSHGENVLRAPAFSIGLLWER